MIIIVTGTPGTGKTTLSKIIAKKLKAKYIDLNKFAKDHDLILGFDKERDCSIIDEDRLSEKIRELKDNDMVIDSHLSHYIDPVLVDRCIVTKCELKELKERLKKRKYSEKKVRENLDSEIFDTCNIEATEAGYDTIIIFTDKDVEEQLEKYQLI